jgi:methionyl-tRNA formyltransferase
MKQKMVFFGSGSYTIPVVKKLIPHGLDLVITTEKSPDSKLLSFCSENNIKTLTAQTVSELTNHQSLITNHNVAVLASFGAIIPNEIINAFKHGIINIHPSLLPRWKGPSPIQYTLLNGDTQTGVTLIKLDNEIDHGNILSQKTYKLDGNETTQFLLDKLFLIGAEMVEELVIKLEKNQTLTESPQDHSKETWSYKITKEDGMIDFYKLQTTNYKLDNMIRAFYPWPGVWFKNVIARSETTKQSSLNNKIIKLLPEGKIQVEGKNTMSYKDFINGYGDEGKTILQKLGIK